MSIRENDLKYMVSNYISIDEYTSKIDEDNITIAFFVAQLDVANELRDLIEKVHFIEIRDIEIADTITNDNKYIVFVELERNNNFPSIVLDLIDTVGFSNGEKQWKFKSLGMKDKQPLTKENIQKYIRLEKLGSELSNKVQESFKPMIIKDNGWNRKYICEGYISKTEMEKIINESNGINDRDDTELQLLETTFFGYDIITTDKNIFIIKGDKILKYKDYL